MSAVAPRDILLEVCLDSAESAAAAEEGGARRVELCARLDLGGITPANTLLERVRATVSIALHVMIRPRGGDFVYTGDEIAVMKEAIACAKRVGADGVVLGVLRADRTVDRALLAGLVTAARPLAVTFHRAFDETAEPLAALDDIIAAGADILLSSGQRPSAPEGAPLLASLVERAGERLTVMPGAGVSAVNARALLAATGARALHVGTAVHDRPGGRVDAALVRTFLAHLAEVPR